MDRRERYESLNEALIAALTGWQSDLWTALPGIVQGFDAVKQTVSVQPSLKMRVTSPTGVRSWVQLPVLQDCPVHFPRGGNYTLTFPVAVGDECLVVFASRCIDSWWQLGGIQNVISVRMHDLSDGFAIVGFNSKPKVIPNISTTSTQLRDTTGDTVIDLNEGHITVTAVSTVVNSTTSVINASGGAIINGATQINGALSVTGNITSSAGNISAPAGSLSDSSSTMQHIRDNYNAHTHSGVTTGTSNTGTTSTPL